MASIFYEGKKGDDGIDFSIPNKLTSPYSVKQNRKDHIFTAYMSLDGLKWMEIDKTAIKMTTNVYVGFPAISHNDEKLCETYFILPK